MMKYISIATLLVLITAGCSTSNFAVHNIREGIRIYHSGFFSLHRDPSINETITLDEVTIHIVSSKSQLPCTNCLGASYNKSSNGKNEIWILARRDPKGVFVVVNMVTLGHEIQHLLDHQCVVDKKCKVNFNPHWYFYY